MNQQKKKQLLFRQEKIYSCDGSPMPGTKRQALRIVEDSIKGRVNVEGPIRHKNKSFRRSKSVQFLHGIVRQISLEEEKLPKDVVNIDKNSNDPANCDAYAEDIVKYMREIENNEDLKVKHDYLKTCQKSITNDMRAVVIDWLLQVQHHLNLNQETIYKTVILLDRFLSVRTVSTKNFQLVGLSCLFIMSKCVEYNPPPINTLVQLTDHTYTYDNIVRTEWVILSQVQFNLLMVDHSFYVSRLMMASNLSIIDKFDRRTVKIACFYFIDSLMPYNDTIKYTVSKLSSAAVLLARYLLFHNKPHRYHTDVWSPTLHHYSKYKKPQLQCAIRRIAKIISEQPKSKIQGALVKYSSKSKYRNFAGSILMKNVNFEQISRRGI